MQKMFTFIVMLAVFGSIVRAEDPKEQLETLDLLPLETISTGVYKAKIFWVNDATSSRMQFIVLVKNTGAKWLSIDSKKELVQLTDDQGKKYEIYDVQANGYAGHGSTTTITIDAEAQGNPDRSYFLEIRPSQGIVPLQLKSKLSKLTN